MTIQQGVNQPTAVGVPSRSGTSPIGTTSPNTGSAANTNSSYGGGAFASGINPQSGTSYALQNTDYQGVVEFNTASAVSVSLNSRVGTNFTCFICNIGTGAITLTPTTGTVNGSASLALASGQGTTVFFANGNWTAIIGSSLVPVVPSNTPAVTHEWLASYNSTTGVFTQTQPSYGDLSGSLPSPTPTTLGGVESIGPTASNWVNEIDTAGVPHLSQPAFTDISGNLASAQLPAAGLTVVITTAALTALGTQGSMTFTSGILTGQVPAT